MKRSIDHRQMCFPKEHVDQSDGSEPYFTSDYRSFTSEENCFERKWSIFHCIPYCSTCSECCIVGTFLGALVLSIILILWLTSSPNQNISHISNTLNLTTSITISSSSTTSDTTSTTTRTTTTTPSPPCAVTSMGSTTTLWISNVPTTISYSCYAFSWTAPFNSTVSLQFRLQHSPGRWYLDDVSVLHGVTQLVSNGGFESGLLSPWIRTSPNGNACGGQPADVSNLAGEANNGSWFLWDGFISCYDQIEQTFDVIENEIYIISFWIKSTTTGGSPIFAHVLIS